jgi:hypothetical protein
MQHLSLRSHSRLILLIKLLCILLLSLLIISIIFFPHLNVKKKQLELDITPLSESASPNQHQSFVTKPSFFGSNLQNDLYKIVADKALETGQEDHLALENISAEISNQDDLTTLVANNATWRKPDKLLILINKINILFNNYQLNTNSAVLDLAKNIAYGKEKVRLTNAGQTLEAGSFNIDFKQKKLFFSDNIKVIFYAPNTKPHF